MSIVAITVSRGGVVGLEQFGGGSAPAVPADRRCDPPNSRHGAPEVRRIGCRPNPAAGAHRDLHVGVAAHREDSPQNHRAPRVAGEGEGVAAFDGAASSVVQRDRQIRLAGLVGAAPHEPPDLG